MLSNFSVKNVEASYSDVEVAIIYLQHKLPLPLVSDLVYCIESSAWVIQKSDTFLLIKFFYIGGWNHVIIFDSVGIMDLYMVNSFGDISD